MAAAKKAMTVMKAKRVAMRNQEQGATQAALDALQSVSAGATKGVEGGAFLQLSSKSSSKAHTKARAERVRKVFSRLVDVGKEMKSPALIQMATTLRQDYMGEEQQSFYK